jgi:large subunit ribosomal protein L29
MKVHEIRELNVEELNGKVKDLQDQVFRMRIQKAMGQLDAPSKMRTLRRELARVKTVLREKR